MWGLPSRKCLTTAPIKIAKKSANMKSCSRRVNRITEQYTTVLRFVTSGTKTRARPRPRQNSRLIAPVTQFFWFAGPPPSRTSTKDVEEHRHTLPPCSERQQTTALVSIDVRWCSLLFTALELASRFPDRIPPSRSD